MPRLKLDNRGSVTSYQCSARPRRIERDISLQSVRNIVPLSGIRYPPWSKFLESSIEGTRSEAGDGEVSQETLLEGSLNAFKVSVLTQFARGATLVAGLYREHRFLSSEMFPCWLRPDQRRTGCPTG